jgi:hypothetical protein
MTPPSFCLFGKSTRTEGSGQDAITKQLSYNVVLESAIFYCQRLQISPTMLQQVESMMKKNQRLNIQMHSREMKSFTIPTGTLNVNSEILFTGPMPANLVIGLIPTKSFIGDYESSPFCFKKHGLESVTIFVEGDLTNMTRTITFEDGLHLLGYKSLDLLCSKHLGNGIDRTEYRGKNKFLIGVGIAVVV